MRGRGRSDLLDDVTSGRRETSRRSTASSTFMPIRFSCYMPSRGFSDVDSLSGADPSEKSASFSPGSVCPPIPRGCVDGITTFQPQSANADSVTLVRGEPLLYQVCTRVTQIRRCDRSRAGGGFARLIRRYLSDAHRRFPVSDFSFSFDPRRCRGRPGAAARQPPVQALLEDPPPALSRVDSCALVR